MCICCGVILSQVIDIDVSGDVFPMLCVGGAAETGMLDVDGAECHDEAVGTLRWSRHHVFPQLAAGVPDPLRVMMLPQSRGWKDFVAVRSMEPYHVEGGGIANRSMEVASGDHVQFHPSLLDGMSFPMTLASALAVSGWIPQFPQPPAEVATRLACLHNEDGESVDSDDDVKDRTGFVGGTGALVVLVVGASRRAEQRLFEQTNYFNELKYCMWELLARSATAMEHVVPAPVTSISFVLIGPELVADAEEDELNWRVLRREGERNFKLSESQFLDLPQRYALYPGSVENLLARDAAILPWPVDPGSTIAVGFNTGFSHPTHRASWIRSLLCMLDAGILCCFTCPNHDVDLVGELAVWRTILGAKIVVQPMASRFASMSRFVAQDHTLPLDVYHELVMDLASSSGRRRALTHRFELDVDVCVANRYVYAVCGFVIPARGPFVPRDAVVEETHKLQYPRIWKKIRMELDSDTDNRGV